MSFFFFQAEDGIRDLYVTGVQTCALPICRLTRLLTLGKRRAPKGECCLDYADVVAHGEGQIVVVLPPEDGDVAELADRVAADFPGRAYLAAHHLYRGDDMSRLVRLA